MHKNQRQKAYRQRLKVEGYRRLEIVIPPDLWEKLIPLMDQWHKTHPGYAVVGLLQKVAKKGK